MSQAKSSFRILVLFCGVLICQLVDHLIYKSSYPHILNNQAFFSLALNNYLAEIIIVVVLVVLATFFNGLSRYPLILVFAGSISNLIDRLWYGGVIDYLNFFQISQINLADILICLGVCWYLLGLLGVKQKSPS